MVTVIKLSEGVSKDMIESWGIVTIENDFLYLIESDDWGIIKIVNLEEDENCERWNVYFTITKPYIIKYFQHDISYDDGKEISETFTIQEIEQKYSVKGER
jgi:hypothetical protein